MGDHPKIEIFHGKIDDAMKAANEFISNLKGYDTIEIQTSYGITALERPRKEQSALASGIILTETATFTGIAITVIWQ